MSEQDSRFLAGVGGQRQRQSVPVHASVSAIGPCHGPEVEDFLAAVSVVPGGRRLDLNDPIMDDVLAAVGTEVHGYMKLDEERDGRARMKPKRGSTAERLLAIHDLIEQHLS
jgi:hypothetical protein